MEDDDIAVKQRLPSTLHPLLLRRDSWILAVGRDQKQQSMSPLVLTEIVGSRAIDRQHEQEDTRHESSAHLTTSRPRDTVERADKLAGDRPAVKAAGLRPDPCCIDETGGPSRIAANAPRYLGQRLGRLLVRPSGLFDEGLAAAYSEVAGLAFPFAETVSARRLQQIALHADTRHKKEHTRDQSAYVGVSASEPQRPAASCWRFFVTTTYGPYSAKQPSETPGRCQNGNGYVTWHVPRSE